MPNHAMYEKKRKEVTCLPSVTGFSPKLVFNTPNYYIDWANHCTY